MKNCPEDLTLEKLQISKRLGEVELALGKMSTLYTQTHETLVTIMGQHAEKLSEHDKFLYGDYQTKGMNVRMDRLEGLEESRKWTFRTMWVAIITFFSKMVLDFIQHK